ncbi:MAG: hypothetical protein Q7T80_17825 [Methanoregula sp.]|nr:hypothetical protein [Methanoregula sp.]
MTSRRCTVLEQGALELLRLNGYEVRIDSTGQNQQRPLAHLVASQKAGETRYIRIRKYTRRAVTPDQVERCCLRDILRFRSAMAREHRDPSIQYEIWLYTLSHGYRCFEILPERIREIPRIPGKMAVRTHMGEAA